MSDPKLRKLVMSDEELNRECEEAANKPLKVLGGKSLVQVLHSQPFLLSSQSNS